MQVTAIVQTLFPLSRHIQKKQVPPLRCAPVGMTKYQADHHGHAPDVCWTSVEVAMSYIETWNAMAVDAAAAAVLPCCGSKAWARGLAIRRPLATLPELLAASDSAWWSLNETDWKEAFSSHPRIGEQHAQGYATVTSLAWSADEQDAANPEDDEVGIKLAEGNRAYEAKFGRIFIVCATGKSAQTVIASLTQRITNTAEAELHETAEQQRQITHIRLQKWLAAQEADAAG